MQLVLALGQGLNELQYLLLQFRRKGPTPFENQLRCAHQTTMSHARDSVKRRRFLAANLRFPLGFLAPWLFIPPADSIVGNGVVENNEDSKGLENRPDRRRFRISREKQPPDAPEKDRCAVVRSTR